MKNNGRVNGGNVERLKLDLNTYGYFTNNTRTQARIELDVIGNP